MNLWEEFIYIHSNNAMKNGLLLFYHIQTCSDSNILAVANKSVMICKPTIYGNHIP